MVKTLLLLVLLAAASAADDPKKPACNSANGGRFWPDAANTDPALARRMARCGNLEICTFTGWRYKWQSATVNVRQLAKASPAPGCEVAAR